MKNWLILSFLLLVASHKSTAATCRFFSDQFFGYTCELNDVDITEENFDLVINTNNHATGQNDGLVRGFTIGNATMRFFPNSILRQFANLRYLQLDNSGLTALSAFEGCGNLLILRIRGSEIQRIPRSLFFQCSSLGSIDLSRNQITEIDDEAFDGLRNLLQLEMNSNQISRLSSRVFRDLVNLEELDLGRNQIQEIENGAFSTLRGLISFYLNNNRITDIRPEMFGDEISSVNINLNYNELTSVPRLPSRAPRLLYVYLIGNYIEEINSGDFTVGYQNITNLELSENVIRLLSAAPFETLTSLDTLSVNYNGITALDNEFFDRIASLYSFYFEGNSCANVAFRNIRSVDQDETIAATFDRCYYNFFVPLLTQACTFEVDAELGYVCSLSDVTFQTFRDKFAITGAHVGTRQNGDVTAIRITRSNFARVPPTIFRTFPSLESFSLTDSGLEVVDIGTFEECGELVSLDLTGNRIRQLGSHSFANCYSLDRLILDDNRIAEIQPCSSFLLNIPLVRHVSMRRNVCVDRVFQSSEWLTEDYQNLVYRHMNRCFSLFYMFLDNIDTD